MHLIVIPYIIFYRAFKAICIPVSIVILCRNLFYGKLPNCYITVNDFLSRHKFLSHWDRADKTKSFAQKSVELMPYWIYPPTVLKYGKIYLFSRFLLYICTCLMFATQFPWELLYCGRRWKNLLDPTPHVVFCLRGTLIAQNLVFG